jgi:hypothetical protein
MKKLLQKILPLRREFSYVPPTFPRLERQDVERLFTRLFSSDDGKNVLGYLQLITLHRALGAEVNADMLRSMEGQRALVLQIMRLAEGVK